MVRVTCEHLIATYLTLISSVKGAVLDTLSFAAVVRSVVPASVSILIELIQVEQIVTTPEDLIMQEHYLNV